MNLEDRYVSSGLSAERFYQELQTITEDTEYKAVCGDEVRIFCYYGDILVECSDDPFPCIIREESLDRMLNGNLHIFRDEIKKTFVVLYQKQIYLVSENVLGMFAPVGVTGYMTNEMSYGLGCLLCQAFKKKHEENQNAEEDFVFIVRKDSEKGIKKIFALCSKDVYVPHNQLDFMCSVEEKYDVEVFEYRCNHKQTIAEFVRSGYSGNIVPAVRVVMSDVCRSSTSITPGWRVWNEPIWDTSQSYTIDHRHKIPPELPDFDFESLPDKLTAVDQQITVKEFVDRYKNPSKKTKTLLSKTKVRGGGLIKVLVTVLNTIRSLNFSDVTEDSFREETVEVIKKILK